uniref:Transporter n=1 Tax=Parastrongyloides trichosuri TaxID=131310 RepID=A0A0N4ZWV7_PARTI
METKKLAIELDNVDLSKKGKSSLKQFIWNARYDIFKVFFCFSYVFFCMKYVPDYSFSEYKKNINIFTVFAGNYDKNDWPFYGLFVFLIILLFIAFCTVTFVKLFLKNNSSSIAIKILMYIEFMFSNYVLDSHIIKLLKFLEIDLSHSLIFYIVMFISGSRVLTLATSGPSGRNHLFTTLFAAITSLEFLDAFPSLSGLGAAIILGNSINVFMCASNQITTEKMANFEKGEKKIIKLQSNDT